MEISREEKETIELLKKTIKNSNYCDSIGTGQIEILLNYIDKLQKENEYLKEREEHLDRRRDKLEEKIEELEENDLSYQKELGKAWKENAELKEEIDNLIKENHKHIDYIADMKKKHEDKIRTKIKELEGAISFDLTIEVLKELLGDDE
jgi:chromosome segregation ATPase